MSTRQDETTSATRPETGALVAPWLLMTERIVAGILNSALALAAIGIIVSMILVCYAVFMRYFLNAAPTWVDDVTGFLLAAIVMLATGSTLRMNQHISADTLSAKVSAQTRKKLHLFSSLIVAIVSIGLLVNGWETAEFSKMLDIYTSGNVQIPLYQLQLLIPLGAALMLLVSMEAMLRQFCGLPQLGGHGPKAGGK